MLGGCAVGLLAQGGPRHLVASDAGYLPPFAQLRLALVLPARGQQRAIDEVVLELAVADDFPLIVVVLAVVAIYTLEPLALACVSARMVDGGISWVLKLTNVPSISKNNAYFCIIRFIS